MKKLSEADWNSDERLSTVDHTDVFELSDVEVEQMTDLQRDSSKITVQQHFRMGLYLE